MEGLGFELRASKATAGHGRWRMPLGTDSSLIVTDGTGRAPLHMDAPCVLRVVEPPERHGDGQRVRRFNSMAGLELWVREHRGGGRTGQEALQDWAA